MAKKRVHEIAKAQGVSSKELLAALKAAGIEAKAAASSVEEADALRAIGASNGGGGTATQAPPKPKEAPATPAPAPKAAAPAAKQAQTPAPPAPKEEPKRPPGPRIISEAPPKEEAKRPPGPRIISEAPKPAPGASNAPAKQQSNKPGTSNKPV